MTESEIKALVSLITDEDEEVIKMVTARILELGIMCVPFLETEWDRNFGQLIQDRIEDLIQKIQFDAIANDLEQWAKSGSEDLIKGMWLISRYQYPDVPLLSIKADIQQLYYVFWTQFDLEGLPLNRLKKFNDIFYKELGFKPNTKDFHSPNNSMISYVLEEKKGNPISLCVIYMSIAQMLNLPIYGVNLPNLFVLTYKTDQTNFYINAFNKGMIFSKNDVDNYLVQLKIKEDKATYYDPCSNLVIIRRVIKNLIISYEKMNALDKVENMKYLYNIIEIQIGVNED